MKDRKKTKEDEKNLEHADAGEEQKLREALRESQQRFASFMLHLPAAAWMKDLKGRYVYANAEAERIFSTFLSALQGKTDAEVFPPETARQFVGNDQRVLAEGVALRTTEVLRQADGIDHHSIVSKFTVPGPDGQPAYIGGVAFDITDLIQMEEALRDSENTFRGIASAALDAVVLLDNEGNVSFWNDAATEIFGYTNEEITGKYLHSFIMPERHIDTFRKGFEAFRLTGEGPYVRTVYEIEAKRKDGAEFPVELSLAALKLKGKWNAIGIVRDITERRRVEEQAKIAVDELAAVNKELETFSYSVSHDLRSPLRIIRSFSEIVLEEHSLGIDEEAKMLLTQIHVSSGRMDDLIMALLTLAQAGRQQLRISRFDMKELAANVFDELKTLFPGREVQFIVKSLPQGFGDPVLIRQVFSNLLGNALKLTKNREVAKIEVDGWTEQGRNIYCVRDNGAGFDMKFAEKMFEPFQRLHLHKEKEFGGTGLGLSIVQRIISRHGGKVWAEGETGKGAIFYFTLPATGGEGSDTGKT